MGGGEGLGAPNPSPPPMIVLREIRPLQGGGEGSLPFNNDAAITALRFMLLGFHLLGTRLTAALGLLLGNGYPLCFTVGGKIAEKRKENSGERNPAHYLRAADFRKLKRTGKRR